MSSTRVKEVVKDDSFYRLLSEFVAGLGSVFQIVPVDIEPVHVLTSFLPIKFEANIHVEGARSREYYIYLGLSGHLVRTSFSSTCGLMLSGSLAEWISVFKNERTLLGACDMGNITATGIREHFILRMTLYSELIRVYNERKKFLVMMGKIMKIFPKPVLRESFKLLYHAARLLPPSILPKLIKLRGA